MSDTVWGQGPLVMIPPAVIKSGLFFWQSLGDHFLLLWSHPTSASQRTHICFQKANCCQQKFIAKEPCVFFQVSHPTGTPSGRNMIPFEPLCSELNFLDYYTSCFSQKGGGGFCCCISLYVRLLWQVCPTLKNDLRILLVATGWMTQKNCISVHTSDERSKNTVKITLCAKVLPIMLRFGVTFFKGFICKHVQWSCGLWYCQVSGATPAEAFRWWNSLPLH